MESGSRPEDTADTRPGAAGAEAIGSSAEARAIGVGGSRKRIAVAGLLAVLLGGIYLETLHPGVGRGDSAELQYIAALLGVCHSPGYAIEVTFAHLFSRLPLGPSVAWRVNLMMAVCGVVGCLAMYGVVRRITGQIIPAVGAATILGFSSVYWAHSVLAEAYTFYAMFLLLATYAAVRFIASDRAVWLYLAALLLGVCVGDRISEALILPAFLVLWLAYRKQARFTFVRLGASVALFVIPFAYSVTFFMARFDSGQPYARDDFARQRMMGEPLEYPESGTTQRAAYAIRYCLGLQWAKRAPYSFDRLKWDADKYLWLFSGLGGFGDRFEPQDVPTRIKQLQQGRGTAVGALGVVLALSGVWFGRRRWGWVVFGLGLWAGNTTFYVVHQAPDNLRFTTPGIAGLALLAGLGMAVRPSSLPISRARLVCQSACLLAPLFLLVSNHRFMDRATEPERERVEHCMHLAEAPLPRDSIIISHRNSGMVYRYIYHVEADRRDVSVINAPPPNWPQLIGRLVRADQPTFVRTPPGNHVQSGTAPLPGDVVRPSLWARWRRHTPAELAEFGFLAIPQR